MRDPGRFLSGIQEASQVNLLVSHGAASYTCPARCYPRVGNLSLASHTMYSSCSSRSSATGPSDWTCQTPARWIWISVPAARLLAGLPSADGLISFPWSFRSRNPSAAFDIPMANFTCAMPCRMDPLAVSTGMLHDTSCLMVQQTESTGDPENMI